MAGRRAGAFLIAVAILWPASPAARAAISGWPDFTEEINKAHQRCDDWASRQVLINLHGQIDLRLISRPRPLRAVSKSSRPLTREDRYGGVDLFVDGKKRELAAGDGLGSDCLLMRYIELQEPLQSNAGLKVHLEHAVDRMSQTIESGITPTVDVAEAACRRRLGPGAPEPQTAHDARVATIMSKVCRNLNSIETTADIKARGAPGNVAYLEAVAGIREAARLVMVGNSYYHP